MGYSLFLKKLHFHCVGRKDFDYCADMPGSQAVRRLIDQQRHDIQKLNRFFSHSVQRFYPLCAGFGFCRKLQRDGVVTGQAALSKATETRKPSGFKISCNVSNVGLPFFERIL